MIRGVSSCGRGDRLQQARISYEARGASVALAGRWHICALGAERFLTDLHQVRRAIVSPNQALQATCGRASFLRQGDRQAARA